MGKSSASHSNNTTALLLVGCSDSEEPKKDAVVPDTQEIVQNEELTKQVKDEEGVIDGQVYEQNGIAIGTLVLEASVSDEDAKKLAERYAEEIKEEYKDLQVNVQAVRDGENVANITKE